MYLSYGQDTQGNLISIMSVPSGRTDLKCPFCHSPLVAKKGKVLEHHFAHEEKSCFESKQTLKLTGIPFYDLAGGVTNNEFAVLEKVAEYRQCKTAWFTEKQSSLKAALVKGGLLSEQDKTLTLTPLGREVYRYGPLFRRSNSMCDEASLQEKMISARLVMLQHYDAQDGTQTAQFYKQRIEMLYHQHLYVLVVNIELNGIGYPLIKIGMTTREDISERIKEIEYDLRKLAKVINIEPIGFYPNYGSLEKLAHSKVSDQRFIIRQHTEYFSAPVAKARWSFMKLEELGKRSLRDSRIKSTYRDHAERIKRGQRLQKMLHGKHLGRKAKPVDVLLKNHPDIVKAYQMGLSLRKAQVRTGKAINTIRKVYAALKATN
ncbi:GIY-YIG nuclease family protein [Vibrio splendidus]|uniref:GIY-YIG nuclease family protein n=1 Tax=Vibrio splendidus TaxID=29497 RepID=UPI003D147BC3